MYKVNVRWDLPKHRPVTVGDMRLPQTYELHAVPIDDERPALHLVFEVIDGIPQCRAVHVQSTEQGREVRRADLQLPLEDHLEYATQVAAQLAQGAHEKSGTFELSLADPFLRTIRQARRTSHRRGPSDGELRAAVEVYESAERAPTQAVADHFEIAHRTASLWIKRARDKGYLPAAVSGKASR